MHNHLDELLVAVRNECEVHVPEEGTQRHVVVVLVALLDHPLKHLAELIAHLVRNEVGHRPPHHHQVLFAGRQQVHSLGGGIGAEYLPRSRLDLIHRVGRVVDGVAVFLLGGAQQMFARLDIKLRHHQAPLIDRGYDCIAHPRLPGLALEPTI